MKVLITLGDLSPEQRAALLGATQYVDTITRVWSQKGRLILTIDSKDDIKSLSDLSGFTVYYTEMKE